MLCVCLFVFLLDRHLIVMQTPQVLVACNKIGMCPNEDKIKVI